MRLTDHGFEIRDTTLPTSENHYTFSHITHSNVTVLKKQEMT